MAAGRLSAQAPVGVFGEPVARQTRRLLEAAGMLTSGGAGSVALQSTGDLAALQRSASRWL